MFRYGDKFHIADAHYQGSETQAELAKLLSGAHAVHSNMDQASDKKCPVFEKGTYVPLVLKLEMLYCACVYA